MVNYCCIKYEVKFNLDYFFLYDEYFDMKKLYWNVFILFGEYFLLIEYECLLNL